MIDCEAPLGMENGAISDDKIIASSEWNEHAATYARLNYRIQGAWGWVSKASDYSQWLQVDLGSHTSVTAVATQGSPDANNINWVTKYKLKYRGDEVEFHFYKAPSDTSPKVYQCMILAF